MLALVAAQWRRGVAPTVATILEGERPKENSVRLHTPSDIGPSRGASTAMLQGAILDDPPLVDEPSPQPSVEGCFAASRSQSGASAVSARVSHRHPSEGGYYDVSAVAAHV